MKIEFTGRNIRVSERHRELATRRLEKLSRHLDKGAEAHVVLEVIERRHGAEVVVLGKREKLSSRVETSDIQVSLNAALDKIERQAKKHRDKLLKRRRRSEPAPTNDQTSAATLQQEEVPPDTAVIEYQTCRPQVLSAEDAVMRLEAESREQVLLFLDADTNRLNVLYRESDGRFGLIEPQV